LCYNNLAEDFGRKKSANGKIMDGNRIRNGEGNG
jgi:hypothetical protein